MIIEIENVDIIYPNEDSGIARKLKIWKEDNDSVHIDLIDSDLPHGAIIMDASMVGLLIDSLKLVIKSS